MSVYHLILPKQSGAHKKTKMNIYNNQFNDVSSVDARGKAPKVIKKTITHIRSYIRNPASLKMYILSFTFLRDLY